MKETVTVTEVRKKKKKWKPHHTKHTAFSWHATPKNSEMMAILFNSRDQQQGDHPQDEDHNHPSEQYLQSLFERFNYQVMNENMKILLSQFATRIQTLFENIPDADSKTSFIYEYKKDFYRATVSVYPGYSEGVRSLHYYIHLSNDNFLHLPDATYSTIVKGNQEWHQLNSSLKKRMPMTVAYAKTVIGENYDVQFDCPEPQRIDARFRSKNKEKCLTVTFEPGYPETSYEGFWFDCPSDAREIEWRT